MKKFIFIQTTVLFLAISNIFSQPAPVWLQSYNGPNNTSDKAYILKLDGSGNVYVAGRCNDEGSTADYVIIKYNSAGVQQWVRRYNGPYNNEDIIHGMAVDNSGNVYVTGRSQGLT